MSPRPASPARRARRGRGVRPTPDDAARCSTRAARLEKHPLARLITLVEQDARRGPGAPRRRCSGICGSIRTRFPLRARVIGVTGTPGSGKSTLIGRLALELLGAGPAVRVAVLAIDPSSVESGGALLGDRLRTHFPVGEPRIFFRSQATQGDLGGVGRRTFAVTRLLRHLFDFVFVETVGIGQSEIEITPLADATVLVLQPLAGRSRAVPEGRRHGGARTSSWSTSATRRGWRGAACTSCGRRSDCARIGRRDGAAAHHVFQTSALRGTGVAELAAFLRDHVAAPDAAALRQQGAALPRARRSPSATAASVSTSSRRFLAARGDACSTRRATRSSRPPRSTRSARASADAPPMLRLYDYLASGNGYKVRLLLHQLGIPFERVELDIVAGETRTPAFLARNPNGRIPTLELEDGTYLAESNAILCYLAEGTRVPARRPPRPRARCCSGCSSSSTATSPTSRRCASGCTPS